MGMLPVGGRKRDDVFDQGSRMEELGNEEVPEVDGNHVRGAGDGIDDLMIEDVVDAVAYNVSHGTMRG